MTDPRDVKDAGPQPSRPDGETPPSSLYLFCPQEDPPQKLEVLTRLESAGYSVAELEEPIEVDGDSVLWSTLLDLGDALPERVFLLVERRDPSFVPWEWSDARWADESEFQQTREARWNIVIETWLDPARPHESYQQQLALAAVVSQGLATACYDANSTLLRSSTTLRELAFSDVPPAPSEFYQLHCVGDEQEAWLHTHGLRRFDLPDLEILRLPEARIEDGSDAVRWLVAYLLGRSIPSEGTRVQYGQGIEVELRPVEKLVRRLPAEDLGGREDHDEYHEGWRLALTDPGDVPAPYVPVRLLERISGDSVIWLSDYETERRARLARSRFGHAATLFYSRQFREKDFRVKVGIPTHLPGTSAPVPTISSEPSSPVGGETGHAGDNREHMWFQVTSVGKDRIDGTLLNRPIHATHMREGKSYTLSSAEVSDYQIRLDEDVYTPTTITEVDLVTLRTFWQEQRRFLD